MVSSSRFAIWLLVITLIIGSFWLYWGKVEPKTEETAYEVVARLMIDRANYYKQYWILHKYPSVLTIDGKEIHYSPHGWILPEKKEKADCDYWFELLHPDIKVFGKTYHSVEGGEAMGGYQCHYQFSDRKQIAVTLKNKSFSVDIKS